MKRILIFMIGGFLLLATVAKTQTDEQKANKIDSIIQAYTNQNKFCGSVLVAKKGKVLLSKGYGMANYSYNIPNSGTTKFKLASVSKQFTSMAIMILQERGKLSTEDKLTKYIPDYPNGDKITIHNLLTHSSGIPDVTSLPIFDSIMTIPHTLEQMISYTKNKPLEFEPGTKFKYSNSGYILLTYIIEKATGKNYGDFIQENIFTPLGMKNSGLYKNNEILKNVALGYTEGEKNLENAQYIDMSIPSGAGALYSTVEDMFLWDQALYTEKLVKKATLEKIFTPFKDNYAYGWMIDKYNDHKWISHSGGIQGFSTVINRFTDDEICIVILKNVDNYAFFSANKICRAIMFGDKYELPVEHKVADINKKVYAKLVGDYELMPGFVLSITAEGDKIFSQATGQSKLEIFPEGEYKYFLKIVDAQLEFSKNDKGEIVSVTLLQGGKKMPGKKIK